ncbi:uncharacterized protein LOC114646109 [Erpetoichthys calabaricus]|uniref:uncharacterized protein LOC114646109 n=1 Tax=Erpetoichthys calabaricus TaxID=27687 RepID=UPI00109FC727|nr:uncharacterized protein LOC114646109 [Erpetoichthys calabaricus]
MACWCFVAALVIVLTCEVLATGKCNKEQNGCVSKQRHCKNMDKPVLELQNLLKMSPIISRGDRIILCIKQYETLMMDKNRHHCVLKKVFHFYSKVLHKLAETTPELHFNITLALDIFHRMNRCLRCVRCNKQEESKLKTPLKEDKCEGSFTAEELEKLQIQKLKKAKHQLNDPLIQRKAIEELPRLLECLPHKWKKKKCDKEVTVTMALP